MRKLLPLVCVTMVAVATPVAAQLQTAGTPREVPVLTREQAIAAAVLPLPPEFRDGAGVIQWNDTGRVELRPSANGFVCIADPPGDAHFDVRCYQAPYVAVMGWGRSLRRELPTFEARRARINEEVRSGRLVLPPHPSTGYRMLGPIGAYDAATNRVSREIRSWQSLHIPFATASQLGIPEQARGTHPYMMAAGSWWAHVMVVHDSATSDAP